ncbi:MAG: hypothetical protein U5R06_10340 [candidate division KSB1 bacterium]|nr:hypothetical protein [candidate division KSB1 bacterium]
MNESGKTMIGTLKKLTLLAFLISAGFVHSGIVVLGGLTHEQQLSPGEEYKGVVELENLTDEPGRVRIYQTDYFFNAAGETHYPEPGSLDRSNAEWIEFTPKELIIEPRQRTVVNYQLTVPESESLSGTYWSMLMVENVPEIDPDQIRDDAVTVQSRIRYGIQMVTNIGATGTKKITFLQTEFVEKENRFFLQVDYENKGTRILRPLMNLEVYNDDGELVGRFEHKKQKSYPGTSNRIHIELEDVQTGTYQALLIADCGQDDLFGIRFTLELNK